MANENIIAQPDALAEVREWAAWHVVRSLGPSSCWTNREVKLFRSLLLEVMRG